MDAFEICALIFAILLCLLTAPNILFYSPEHLAAIYLDPAATVDNLTVSIVIMVGACRRLNAGFYKVCMIILIITDALSFFFVLSFRYFNIFNLVKLINIAIITPLIIFIDKIRKKRETMPTINQIIDVSSSTGAQNPPLAINAYQPPS